MYVFNCFGVWLLYAAYWFSQYFIGLICILFLCGTLVTFYLMKTLKRGKHWTSSSFYALCRKIYAVIFNFETLQKSLPTYKTLQKSVPTYLHIYLSGCYSISRQKNKIDALCCEVGGKDERNASSILAAGQNAICFVLGDATHSFWYPL